MGSKKKVKFNILGREWTAAVLPDKAYQKKHRQSDSWGITDGDKREIDILPKGLVRVTMIHELVHAYMFEMAMSSVDFDNDNLEEVFAELMAHRGEEILTLADTLLKRLKK